MRKSKLVAVAIVFATMLCVSARSTIAATFQIDFSGTLNNNVSGTSIFGGDSITGSVLFNADASPQSGNSSGAQFWNNATVSSLVVDGESVGPGNIVPVNFTNTQNNAIFANFYLDATTGPFAPASGNGSMNVIFQAPTLLADALDLSSLTLAQLLAASFSVRLHTNFSFAGSSLVNISSYNITAVPLPAALPLFGAGLGLMGAAGWWKRRKRAAQS